MDYATRATGPTGQCGLMIVCNGTLLSPGIRGIAWHRGLAQGPGTGAWHRGLAQGVLCGRSTCTPRSAARSEIRLSSAIPPAKVVERRHFGGSFI